MMLFNAFQMTELGYCDRYTTAQIKMSPRVPVKRAQTERSAGLAWTSRENVCESFISCGLCGGLVTDSIDEKCILL